MLRDWPLRAKLTFLAFSAATIAVGLVVSGLLLYEYVWFRNHVTKEAKTLADITASHSTAALTFDDTQTLRENVHALSTQASVTGAYIFGPKHELLARYVRDSRGSGAAQWAAPGIYFERANLTVVQPVLAGHDIAGYVRIDSDLSAFQSRMGDYAQITIALTIVALLAALASARRLGRKISNPILQVAALAYHITARKDYAARSPIRSLDEIGVLSDALNGMLNEIQARDSSLATHREQLEVEVQTRTAELMDANEKLRTAKDRAEEGARIKSEFLANMSHEIRTPMNGILGMTALALGTQLDPEQKEYMETVRTSAENLLSIINDILDVSRLEAKRLRLDSVEFILADKISAVAKTVALKAHTKGLEFLIDVHPDTPEVVTGDPVRLSQVLVNLLGNAVKFTEAGEVRLTIEPVPSGLRFTVSDTGIGIAENKQKSVFEAFSQADGSVTRRFGGTGLGLSICSQLVGLMGGDITLESTVGQGSEFSFAIPLATRRLIARNPGRVRSAISVISADTRMADRLVEVLGRRYTPVRKALDPSGADVAIVHASVGNVGQVIESAGSTPLILIADCCELPGTFAVAGDRPVLVEPVLPGDLYAACDRLLGMGTKTPDADWLRFAKEPSFQNGRSLDVLLVEDNPVNQRFAMKVLEKAGHRVTSAMDGAQALQWFRQRPFDVILMDVQMPVLGGFDATATIRREQREGRVSETPIIGLTAHALEGDRQRCLAAGMNEYLSKPFRAVDLLEKLRLVMETRPELREDTGEDNRLDTHLASQVLQ